MAIQPYSQIRQISGITDAELDQIKRFLQGAVYSWSKNRKGEFFSARDLMGGDNYNWNGTPLQSLFDYQQALGKNYDDCVRGAGIALGWVLKEVLHSDKRTYLCDYNGRTARYIWNGQGT
jgi:hypothetical protein